ncbi:MAG: DNA starvation/stationary phase protection protein [Gammaproteobacteria bacterium]
MKSHVFATKAHETPVEIGVDRKDRKSLANDLSIALADTYMVYGDTQSVHWNATGPLFYSLHQLTEVQYRDLAEAIDALAERIRAIGFPAPGGLRRMVSMSALPNQPEPQSTEEMIKWLVEGNERCARSLREAVKRAEESEDVKTADLLTDRIGQHEENIWMLRSLLA